jgi:hypothetical protein
MDGRLRVSIGVGTDEAALAIRPDDNRLFALALAVILAFGAFQGQRISVATGSHRYDRCADDTEPLAPLAESGL